MRHYGQSMSQISHDASEVAHQSSLHQSIANTLANNHTKAT